MADTESGLNETSLRHRLKRETAAVHQHVEAQLGLLDPSLDVHRYLRVLQMMWFAHTVLSSRVACSAKCSFIEAIAFMISCSKCANWFIGTCSSQRRPVTASFVTSCGTRDR
jgi:hypothetical protein